MKKYLKFFILLLCIILLTGCVSEKAREDIIKTLTKNDIINKKWKRVDTITCKQNGGVTFPGYIEDYYDYVYKDKDDNYYLIRIDSKSLFHDNIKEYTISSYKVNQIDELIPYIKEEKSDLPVTVYLYNEKGTYLNNIYIRNLSDQKDYLVTKEKKKILLFKYYKWTVSEKID